MPLFSAIPGRFIPGKSLLPALVCPLFCVLYFYFTYRSRGYLAGGLMVLVAFYALFAFWPRVGKSPLGPAILATLALSLPALGMWQAMQLHDLGDLDHAMYVCAFWNMMQGGTRYSLNDLDIFGTHANYTSALWIPVQFLAGEYALKIGKALCLLAAVFLAFRRHFLRGQDGRAASLGAAALLLSPAVASQFFFGFHPEFLAAPLLVLAFEAYRDGRLGRFLLLTGLLAYTKEVFTLAVGGILLLALLERRPWKWIFAPGLLCFAQMAVYWFLIKPHFSGGENHLTSAYMPTSLGQVADSWFRLSTLKYAVHVTLPFLPLMLALPGRYLVLPLPLMAFYAAFPNTLFLSQWPNYAFPLAFLCAAGVVLERDLRFGNTGSGMAQTGRGPGPIRLDGRILLACATLSLLSYPLWREVLSVPHGHLERTRQVKSLRASIPDGASVLVHGPIAVRFAARKEVQAWGLRKSPLDAFDYAVIDAKLPYWVGRHEELARDIQALSTSPLWIREYGRDSLFLFRRRADAAAGAAAGTNP